MVSVLMVRAATSEPMVVGALLRKFKKDSTGTLSGGPMTRGHDAPLRALADHVIAACTIGEVSP